MSLKPEHRIVGVYFIVALLWILLSDGLLLFLGMGAVLPSKVSILKGVAFVIVTSAILYALLRREFGVRSRLEAELHEQINLARQSQTEWEASEQRFRKAVEEAPFPTLIYAEDGQVLTISRTWLEITGYSPEQLKTVDAWTELAYGDRKQSVHEIINRLFTLTQRVDEGEFTIRTADGGQRIWKFSSTPLGYLPDNRRVVISMAADVTERWRAEQDLRRTQNVLQRIFDNSHFLLAYLDADLNFIQVNERFAVADNRRPEYYIGKNHFDLYPSEENEAIFRHVVATGQSIVIYAKPFVYPHNPERGLSYWDWGLVPIIDHERQVEGLVFTLIDVTERVHAVEKLVENERFINSILRAVPNFIYVYDLYEDRINFANEGAVAVLGLTAEEIVAMGPKIVSRLTHPGDLPAMLEKLQSIIHDNDDRIQYQVICRMRHRDGTWRWLQIQAVSFTRNDNGRPNQIIGSAIDISEMKLIEEQLRVKDSAIASSITPIALADLEGRLTYINKAFLRLWKYEDETQVIGRSVAEFWTSSEDVQLVIDSLFAHDTYVGEMQARLTDGSVAEIELSASMVRDARGTPICLMGSFNDVTMQKRAKRFELENARLKAGFQKEQERNALVQRVISALSHDLRTPLTVISTSRELLEVYYDKLTPEKRIEKLDAIGRQTQFALELLDDTVKLVRGNLTDVPFRPAPVNIAALCQVSVNEVHATKEHPPELRFVNVSHLGLVSIDEVLVSRILLNLLSNAVKYSPPHNEIRLELDRRENWIVLRVVDSGIGISAADLPYIFDPFYRSTAVGTIKGTGLGLSIVKDCVDRHHGRISVESRVNEGTTFTIELPLHEMAVLA